LVGEAFGELDENVLVIRRIHVRMRLKTGDWNRETATRVHGIFADRCPVYRSLKPAIVMTTEPSSNRWMNSEQEKAAHLLI
jgi:uncharacterized OsmC-like protein